VASPSPNGFLLVLSTLAFLHIQYYLKDTRAGLQIFLLFCWGADGRPIACCYAASYVLGYITICMPHHRLCLSAALAAHMLYSCLSDAAA
jgi:hypothetical protein